jgi:hypothetical protein
VAEHPELKTPEAQERLSAWLEEEERMAKTTKTAAAAPVSVRLDSELVERLDRVAEYLSRPGLKLARMDALRIALAEGLTVLEADMKKGPRRA